MKHLPYRQQIPLQSEIFQLRLLWDDDYANVDFSALMITETGKIFDKNYFVFYNSECRVSSDYSHLILRADKQSARCDTRPCDPEVSVVGSCDSSDDILSDCLVGFGYEWFGINLLNIRKEIQEILFIASIYDNSEKYTFKGQLLVQIWENEVKVGEWDFSEHITGSRAFETVKIKRINTEWFISSVGKCYRKGLSEVIEKYC